jgi:hypothetical protein
MRVKKTTFVDTSARREVSTGNNGHVRAVK